ncbi:MAG: hypothetical protein OEV00_13930 [Acidobacteriota bacterium]|nr:hypothetical protein [Acidobacteriota bacterium]MDH3786409.1 hypothetical protein [Acidobacteriota bacterium]
MIQVKEQNNATPLCPHCSETIGEIWFRQLSGMFGRRYVYFCSACRKVLGVSHRKGFWMG